MKKRIAALLLCCAMLLTLSPSLIATAAAEDDAAPADTGIHETVLDDANGVTVEITAPDGAFPAGTTVSVQPVTDETVLTAIDSALTEQEAQYNYGPLAYDITFTCDGEEVQPADGYQVQVSFQMGGALPEDTTALSVYHMSELAAPRMAAARTQSESAPQAAAAYTAELVATADSAERIDFAADAFSIYVVTGYNANDWNRNNYKIVLSVGDSREVTATGENSRWTVADSSIATVRTAGGRTTITANAVGQTTLSHGRDTIQVVVVAAAGSSIRDDIVFANVTAAHESNDPTSITEYGNTYGPYVMKIRFEDTNGDLLAMQGAQDYYVFDSAVSIDLNTFAAIAPDGYTYSGSFFYWESHYSGQKSYVSRVERQTRMNNYGSYLYFDWTTSAATTVTRADHYQPSGVLHIVYAKSTEAYQVVFKDHDGYSLQSFAILHNDSGNKIPASYVTTLETTLRNGIAANHGASGYEFNDSWVVTGGGRGIDGTYSTAQLMAALTTWSIASNITITAQCSEPDVTIRYQPVTAVGGSVSPESEKLKVVSDTAQGSVPTANEGYRFVGWFTDEACTQSVDAGWVGADGKIVPQKVDGKNVAATYYAKFEPDVTDLTIVKTYPDGMKDANQSAVFTITGGDLGAGLKVVLNQGNNFTVTIKGLKANTEYTVTEDNGWTWRYENNAARKITLNVDASRNTVTFANKLSNSYWLSGGAYCDNRWSTSNTPAIN